VKQSYANPYLVCNDCGGWVTGGTSVVGEPLILIPCEHTQGYEYVCPSWSPVSGCTCANDLGAVFHRVPTEIAEGQVW
jgi:hypothetical protein